MIPTGITAKSFRPDIQGLRAVAVVLVLVFHVWPGSLPGGYVGVDVFFVVSGFLITGLLLDEVERTGGLRLGAFYKRRIRRLLPAASVVLVAVTLAVVAWFPVSSWRGLAWEIVASALYVENLLLAEKAVDYLALDARPSPVKHYWSLAVEEQFYILWPLLMLATVGAARRLALRPKTLILLGLGGLTLASFGYSVHLTARDPAVAYFVTTTRVWELGIGGVLAILLSGSGKPRPGSGLLGWIGLAAILFAAVAYSGETAFPGYMALLPTLGAAALIYAAPGSSGLLGRALAVAPMQFVGGISYSLYLWHWPLVVFYEPAVGRELAGLVDGLAVVIASLGLAYLSKRLVEDRFRVGKQGELARPWALGATFTAAAVVGALWMGTQGSQRVGAALADQHERPGYPGASALLPGVSPPEVLPFLPEAQFARSDLGPAYGIDGSENCIGPSRGSELLFCEYGAAESATHLVVVGDSHAVHWLPAFQRIAEQGDVRVTGLTKSSCPLVDLTVRFIPRGASVDQARAFDECREWGRKAMEWILSVQPDLVIFSHSPQQALVGQSIEESQGEIAAGAIRYIERLEGAGIGVSVIRHTPWHRRDGPLCMAEEGATSMACGTDRNAALPMGSLEMAAVEKSSIAMIDMEQFFCFEGWCPAVIGNVLVHRDRHHLTATYARTLAPMLSDRIDAILDADALGERR